MKVRFTRTARGELREAAQWYEASRPGLGKLFRSAVQDAVNRLMQYPESGAIDADNFRRGLVYDFPYILWYEILDREILIHAVFHTRREPGCWKE